ncbi:MAG: HalOD1 output domain-containing protein [Haloferacaceae archaeon]
MNVVDAVGAAVTDAIQQWPELSETPPLYQFVDVEKLDGLFKPKATDDSGWLPSAEFRFQGCRVTVLYGSSIRVIIRRTE